MPPRRTAAYGSINAYIPEYQGAGRFFQHEPRRKRRLLLQQGDGKLSNAVERQGMTIVPLELYFNQARHRQAKLALGEGKKLHDKREAAKKRDWNQKARIMRERGDVGGRLGGSPAVPSVMVVGPGG